MERSDGRRPVQCPRCGGGGPGSRAAHGRLRAREEPTWRVTRLHGQVQKTLAGLPNGVTIRFEGGRLQGFGICNQLTAPTASIAITSPSDPQRSLARSAPGRAYGTGAPVPGRDRVDDDVDDRTRHARPSSRRLRGRAACGQGRDPCSEPSREPDADVRCWVVIFLGQSVPGAVFELHLAGQGNAADDVQGDLRGDVPAHA